VTPAPSDFLVVPRAALLRRAFSRVRALVDVLKRPLLVVRLSANSMSMGLRHAAALALVLWYMMAPPPIGADGTIYSVDAEAPLTLWTMIATFSSDQECLQAKKKMQPSATNHVGPASSDYVTALPFYRCISSDNPLVN
jgi:hypothetical protein